VGSRSGEPGTAARRLAVRALLRVEEGGYSNLVLPGLLRSSPLPPRDRALVTDLVYGTLRRQGSVDHLLALVADRPLAGLDPPVRAALRLGAYQLLTGLPPHAAVSATVGAVSARLRSYVNGVLRSLARLGPPWPFPTGDDPAAVAVRTSHPVWLVERLLDDLGPADALATLEADNEPPAVTLRPNRRRTDAGDLAAELAAAGAEAEPGSLVSGALRVRGIGDPGRLPAVAQGRATHQDEASQAVAFAVDAQPGDDVLDVAAAPGGKSTAMAEVMNDTGRVVAGDLRPGRATRVLEAARRLGLTSVHVVVADGRALPVPPGRFDRVLLDAPCSGFGVLRRRPEARWRRDPADPARLAALQRRLLAASADAVRPGGRLVYSACTFTREETIDIDAWTAEALPGFQAAEPPPSPWRPCGRGALLLPHDAGTDGMYLLVLQAPD
jgi:16S rRNA (cytosine967-C5)-methyltransferase